MQLRAKPIGVRTRLIAASCTLLSAGAARAQEGDPLVSGSTPTEWIFDSVLAYYQEGDGRVRAIEPVVTVRKDFGDDKTVGANLTFDSLSGSTPNGALVSNRPQTFATPSGSTLSPTAQTYTTASGRVRTSQAAVYGVAAGELPLDPTFRDQRFAASINAQLPLTHAMRVTFGGGASAEHDFTSASLSAGLLRDFNNKNTTLSFGVNGEFDSIKPVGGAPVAGSDYALFQKRGSDSKLGVGAMLGITQILNRHWIAQFNLSADRFTGYLNDPYKIVSIIDPAGATTGYLYEMRPETRLKKIAYLENRVGFERASIALSTRYMTDDWGIKSKTAELSARWWNTDKDRFVEPTLRWYQQSAANFYRPWLWTTSAQYVDVSADARLSAFSAVTVGLKYAVKTGRTLGSAGEFSVRANYYRQTSNQNDAAPAVLNAYDLYPGMNAFMVQIGWRFGY